MEEAERHFLRRVFNPTNITILKEEMTLLNKGHKSNFQHKPKGYIRNLPM